MTSPYRGLKKLGLRVWGNTIKHRATCLSVRIKYRAKCPTHSDMLCFWTPIGGGEYNVVLLRNMIVNIDRNMIEILSIGVQKHTVLECVGQQCQNKTPRLVP